MVKYLIFSVAILAFVSVIQAQNSCHLRELDLCIASGLASGQNLATTVAEITKQCNGIQEMKECIGNFSRRCATKSMRELSQSLMSQNNVKWYKEFCFNENSKERADYLKYAGCLSQAQKESKSCIRDLTFALDHAFSSSVEKRIPEICCAVKRLSKCYSGNVESKCGEEGLKYIKRTLKTITGKYLSDVVCRDYDPSSEQCTSILPPPGSSKPSNTRSNSVLSRLLNAYSAL